MYEVIYRKKIEKKLLKQSPEISEKFRKIVEDLQNNPYQPHSKIKKLRKSFNSYRYKSPPYSLLYIVNKKQKVIYAYDFFRRGRGYR